jgi:hypothetical protein
MAALSFNVRSFQTTKDNLNNRSRSATVAGVWVVGHVTTPI